MSKNFTAHVDFRIGHNQIYQCHITFVTQNLPHAYSLWEIIADKQNKNEADINLIYLLELTVLDQHLQFRLSE